MKKKQIENNSPDGHLGYVQIYTGNGKGKTTAALGLALRAAGSGLKTYFGQFLKGQKYGELKSIKHLAEYITIEQFGKDTFVHVDKATDEDIAMARNGLDKCRNAILSGNYDIVVMDEVCMAIRLGVLTDDEVLQAVDLKPENVELVLTGRYATKELIDKADLVTEMVEVKHYYQNGVSARVGIEK